jgi:hypothetical protein
MTGEANILMVGLSDSGKTTFLAALYELVRAEITPDDALRLVEEPEERAYFHEIAQTWLRLERLTHTTTDEPRHAALSLKTQSDERFELKIPDISGEHFNHSWEGDPLPDDVKAIAAGANGVLIFARRDQINEPLLLPPDGTAPDEGKTDVDWSAEDSPTQTKLADLLETLDSLVPGPLPIAVIAYAWDATTEEDAIRPDQWLRLRLPLLWQMLESRKEERPYSVFGVSAQGGDVLDPAEKQRLAELDPPWRRIQVQHEKGHTNDISAPISWLFEHVK